MPHVTSFRRPPSGRAETLQRALDFHRQGKLDKAGRLYQQLLKVNPDHFDALHLLGVLRGQEGRNDVGFELISRALTVRPHSAEALGNLANVLQGLGRHEEAVAAYDKVLAINPRDPSALNNRGNALQALKKYEEALVSHDKALAINAHNPEALNNRGATLAKLHRHEEAVASFDRALAMIPDYAEALCNRGLALVVLHRYSEAIASYDRALAVRPHQAEDWLGRGVLLSQLKRFDQARAAYEKALGINPDLAEAWLRLGEVSYQLGQYDGALAALDKALLIKPRLESTEGFRVHVKMQMCDWTHLETECLQVITAVRQGIRACDPFPMLAIESSPADQLNCARLFVTDQVFVPQRSMPRRMAHVNHRVRIAYLSADFNNHATAHLVAELFELHDRTRFDVIGISFGPDDGSEIRRRLVKAFDQFHDVRSKSDLQVAQLINESSVGIAVDLKGHTADSRLGILACRPAPIQVEYLGYPGTSGADFIDYIIADGVVAPFEHQQFYTERIVHLPGSYQVNDSKRRISARIPTRREVGLPEQGLVFCCFNNNYKITPPTFDRWMQLLRQVEGSVLWLLRASVAAEENLRKEAAARGIHPARLVFADKVKMEDHLARHRLADLFLDTLPYNAHTTASDALWAGLPVLTCKGETFASRVGASVLAAAGLPELVTDNLEEYEGLALKLAIERDLLQRIRDKLQGNRGTCPLFDTRRFCSHIETAYSTMWETHLRGDGPRSFAVSVPSP